MGFLIILAVLVVLVWYFASSMEKRSKLRNTAASSASAVIPVKKGKANKKLTEQFQEWAEASLTTVKDKELKEWLAKFSQKEAEEFTKQVAAFCASVNLDLAWLVDNKLEKNAALEKAAKNVVISYCHACFQAAQSQEDLKTFEIYQSILNKPTSKANKVLGQAVFAELVKQDMAPAISPELFMASEKEQQTHVLEAVQKAAENDPVKFNAILKQVLEPEEEKAGESVSFLGKMRGMVSRKKPDSSAENGSGAEAEAVAAEEQATAASAA